MQRGFSILMCTHLVCNRRQEMAQAASSHDLATSIHFFKKKPAVNPRQSLEKYEFVLNFLKRKKKYHTCLEVMAKVDLVPKNRGWIPPKARRRQEPLMIPAFKRLMMPFSLAKCALHHGEAHGSRERLLARDPRSRCLSMRNSITTSSWLPSTMQQTTGSASSRCMHRILHVKISSRVLCSRQTESTSTSSSQRKHLASSTWT